MVKLISKQRYKNDCGPVAIINTIRKLGCPFSYKGTKDLFKFFGYSPEYGMKTSNLKRCLRFFGVKYKQYHNPKIQVIKESIRNGNFGIILYCDKDSGHFTVVTREYKKDFKAYNSMLDGSDLLSKSDLSYYRKNHYITYIEIL